MKGTIVIENRQTDEDGATESFTQQADCLIRNKNGKIYVTYAETKDTVEHGVESMLKIDGGRITLRRRGVYQSVMVYETGRIDSFLYSMPFGEIPMEAVTKLAQVEEHRDCYRVELQYTLKACGHQTDNHIRITVYKTPLS